MEIFHVVRQEEEKKANSPTLYNIYIIRQTWIPDLLTLESTGALDLIHTIQSP